MHSSRGCEGIQDSSLQAEEKVSGSYVPWHNDSGDITGKIPSKVIMYQTAQHFNIDVRELLANRREHADTRCLGILIAHNLTLESTVAIGRAFQRDHTTVMYNIKKARILVNDSQWREHYQNIVNKILESYFHLRKIGWVE